MGDVNISSGFDKVRLPADLTQLYLNDSENDAITQLKLPENLQYLDLSKAQLSDYSFIRQAKHLRYLNLESSNFHSWSILKTLTQLEALNLNYMALTEDDIKQISELNSLKFLSIADTKVTDIRPLTALENLLAINTGFNEIPFDNFPDIAIGGYIGFPAEDYYFSKTLPEHISALKEKVFIEFDDCVAEKVCTIPPWWGH
jgi:Leucine-rich repeat (LRR) protein